MNRIDHNDPEVDSFLHQLKEVNLERSCYMILLTGRNNRAKRSFMDQLSTLFGRSVTPIDLSEMDMLDQESFERQIESTLQELGEEELLLCFSHGDRLGGPYTNFTHSKVRYSTPQERYLLNRLSKLEKIILIDVQDESNVSKSLERHAHALIRFEPPVNFFKRCGWNLRNINFHGYSIPSRRPVAE